MAPDAQNLTNNIDGIGFQIRLLYLNTKYNTKMYLNTEYNRKDR